MGGIFRHVRDLIDQQVEAGHEVGVLCDSSTGGAYEDELFKALEPKLALGLSRIPMRRAISPTDLVALWRAFGELRAMRPDILHAHGAKGGAYARIIGTLMRLSGRRIVRLYCPHGGSIHYDPASFKGRVFFKLERFLEMMTDRLIFVSRYEQDGYAEKVGPPRCPASLVYNGLRDEEFTPVPANRDGADFLYIGMMRDLKGPDLFIDAIGLLGDRGIEVSCHFVGDGPDKPVYLQTIEERGLSDRVTVHDPMPAREAFKLARTVVVPSRAESMPYIVLEAIAAGKPLLATAVGGIPEILSEEQDSLIVPGSAEALADAMERALQNRAAQDTADGRRSSLRKRFSTRAMAQDIEHAYRASLGVPAA